MTDTRTNRLGGIARAQMAAGIMAATMTHPGALKTLWQMRQARCAALIARYGR